MKEQINQKLKILQYDKNRHSSLKAALEEVLSQKKYNEIMRGIINDSNAMSEVRNIIDAYKFLKDYEDTIIDDKEINEELDEIIIFKDNKDYRPDTVILKKNKDKNSYEEIAKDKKIYIGENFFVLLDKGEFYNFQGELVFKREIDYDYDNQNRLQPCIKQITDKIIEVGYYNKDYILLEKDINNKFIVLNSLQLPNNGIFNCASLSNNNKNKIFRMIYENKKLDYLGAMKIFCNGDYIFAQLKHGEVAYFTIDGEKIISTDQDNYCYIEQLKENHDDNSHIIVVARYDTNLNKLYGYYDLDERKEVVKPVYEFARPWLGYYGMVLTPEVCLITRDEKLINYNHKLSDKHTNYKFPTYCLQGYEEIMKKFFISDDAPWDYGHMGVAEKLIKIKENLYLVRFRYISPHISCRNKFALVSNIETNPQIISNTFSDCYIRRDENEIKEIYVECYPNQKNGRSDRYWERLLFDGRTINIINNSINKTNELDSPDKINYLLSKNNNSSSSFLLPEYTEEVDDNEYVTALITKQKNELDSYRNFKPNSNNNCNIDYISDIKTIDKYGNVLFEYVSEQGNYCNSGIVNKDGQNIFVDKAEPIGFDDSGNCILNIIYGSSERKIVSNSDGNIIIGPSVDIFPSNGAYIVNRNDKYQVFDTEGNPISYEAEHQQWANKLYVNKNGIVKKKEDRLLIKNYGFTYLVDDTGDIIINQDPNSNDIFEELKLIKSKNNKNQKKLKK